MAKIKLSKPHAVEELEVQFHNLQKKILEARDNYVENHQKEIKMLRKKTKQLREKFAKVSSQAAKATGRAKKTGTKVAKNQYKKIRAASLLLGNSLKETKQILVTAENNLQASKPFDRKLHARAKVLAQFEKDWDKKIKAEAKAREQRSKRAATKQRTNVSQPGVANQSE
jgi:uncharacterized coiled-coil protein SlyX